MKTGKGLNFRIKTCSFTETSCLTMIASIKAELTAIAPQSFLFPLILSSIDFEASIVKISEDGRTNEAIPNDFRC